MTAKETRRFKPVLEAIRKDKFDEYVMNVYTKQIRERQKEQAKRNKLLAVFNVLSDTPAAIVQGLSQGGPAGAVLAAGIAAVQLATRWLWIFRSLKKGLLTFKGKAPKRQIVTW